MKFALLSLLMIGIGGNAWASNSDEAGLGIDYFKAGMYMQAKYALLDEVTTGSNKAELCYYLGETYFALNNTDSASYYYKQGLVADPTYVYNTIGEVKIALRSNPNADSVFSSLLVKKNKKDPKIYVAMARAYPVDRLDKINFYLEGARSVNPNSPDIFIAQGDLLVAQKRLGEGSNLYEQAIYFDPKNKEAYQKYARVYENNNPELSIEMLNKLISMNPGYRAAYRDLANIYFENQRYAEAVETYDQFIDLSTSNPDDLARYATLLFYSGKVQESQDVANRVLRRDPNNIVLKRLDIYSNYDMGNYESALEASRNFVNTVNPDYINGRDYLYLGRSLAKSGESKEAYTAFRNAFEKDTSKIEYLSELAYEMVRGKDFQSAIEVLEEYVAHKGDKTEMADNFRLGQAYYFEANGLKRLDTEANPLSSEQRAKLSELVKKGDGIFSDIIVKEPDNYIGYLWRARINVVLDPLNPDTVQGIAIPFYEQTIALLEKDTDPANKEGNSRVLKEAYEVLGVFHYFKDNNELAILNLKKLQSVDPNNANAKAILAGIEGGK